MTITRRFHTGFESGDPEIELLFNRSSSTYSTTAVNVKTGNHSGIVTGDNGSSWSCYFISTTQVRVGFSMRQNGVGAADVPEIATLRHLKVNGIRLTWDGTTFTLYAGATSLGTYAPGGGWPANTWWHFGLNIKIDAASGWAVLYIDGVAQITYSGQTDQGTSVVSELDLGSLVSGVTWVSSAAIDDVFVDDTSGEGAAAAVPMKRFHYILPNADGNYSQFDGSDGNSVNNYLLVDETTQNGLTDYVKTSVASERDSYNLAAPPTLTLETIVAVIPHAVVRNVASAGVCTLFVRLGGIDLDGTSQPIAVDFHNVYDRLTTKPGGGPWTPSDVSATEVGVMNA